MAKVTTMKELADFCKNWGTKAPEPEGFKVIVSSYLTLSGIEQRVLADEFEAAISTISRWASGNAQPRPRMQREVVGWIGKRAAASVAKTSESLSGSSSSWAPAAPISIAAKSD